MRRALLGVVILLAATAATAQDIDAVVGLDQEACASFSERRGSGTLTSDVCGIDHIEVMTDGGLDAATSACASVAYHPDDESETNPSFVDIGCGPLDVEVDPLLEAAHITGTLPSRLYNATTGGFLSNSSLTVDVDWTAKGDPVVGVGETVNVFTLPFVDARVSVVVYKAADSVGHITSGAMGAPAGPATDAVIEEGVDLYVAAAP